MRLIAHFIYPKLLKDKDQVKLKQICQDWTRLGDDEHYVAHHSNALSSSCPLCCIKKES